MDLWLLGGAGPVDLLVIYEVYFIIVEIRLCGCKAVLASLARANLLPSRRISIMS